VRLVGVYRLTEHDDDEAFYVRRLHERCLPQTSTGGEETEEAEEEAEAEGEEWGGGWGSAQRRVSTSAVAHHSRALHDVVAESGAAAVAGGRGWRAEEDEAGGRMKRVGNLQRCVLHGGIFSLGEPDEKEEKMREEEEAGEALPTPSSGGSYWTEQPAAGASIGQRTGAGASIGHRTRAEAMTGHRTLPPVTEDEAVAALHARGFKVFYAGDLEEEWLEQVSP
jgi:hypothetical protein